MDAAHISVEKKSIMNPASPYGFQSREWDEAVTAILLDLGYNVDNDCTRLWGHVNHVVKE